MKTLLLSIILSLTLTASLFAEVSSISEKKPHQSVKKGNWVQEGTYKLSKSNSTLSVPAGHTALIGEDARDYLDQFELSSTSVEAIIFNDSSQPITIRNFTMGYISSHDDYTIFPQTILRATKKSIELQNQELIQKGLQPNYIGNWIQKPIFNPKEKTIYMALEQFEEDKEYVFSCILKLGRFGYVQLASTTQKASFEKVQKSLEMISQLHTFDPGFRYSDYTSGDAVTPYSLVQLITDTLGIPTDNKLPLYLFLNSFVSMAITLGWAVFYLKFSQKKLCLN